MTDDRRAILDTTIQIDRRKTALRRDHIEGLLDGFDWRFSTSIALLEFKAVLIQECVTIHDKLKHTPQFTRVVDRLTESPHPQAKLRQHILRNIINVYAPSSFDITDEEDKKLAEKARLQLALVIPKLHRWFTTGSVDAVLKDKVNCTRAFEVPQKGKSVFWTNIPRCVESNKACTVDSFVRGRLCELIEKLASLLEELDEDRKKQLQKGLDTLRKFEADKSLEFSNSDCRRMGDCLIALEGEGIATHALSTNKGDWAVTSQLAGLKFVPVEYLKEKDI